MESQAAREAREAREACEASLAEHQESLQKVQEQLSAEHITRQELTTHLGVPVDTWADWHRREMLELFLEGCTRRISRLHHQIEMIQRDILMVQLEIASLPTPAPDIPPHDATFRDIDSDSDSEDEAAADEWAMILEQEMDAQEASKAAGDTALQEEGFDGMVVGE